MPSELLIIAVLLAVALVTSVAFVVTAGILRTIMTAPLDTPEDRDA